MYMHKNEEKRADFLRSAQNPLPPFIYNTLKSYSGKVQKSIKSINSRVACCSGSKYKCAIRQVPPITTKP